MILRLFDCSQYIYAGAPNTYCSIGIDIDKDGMGYSKNIPSGGIIFLLNTLLKYKKDDTDLVFVFDGVPVEKRRIYSEIFGHNGYKGNRRPKDPAITVQKGLARELLEMIGYNVIYSKDYEADDCIYSLVQEYKSSYEHIYIHSIDSDLATLVSDNVSMEPVGNRGKVLNIYNWENNVLREYTVKYNALLLHKLTHGEPSDNIPRISEASKNKIYDYISVNDFPKFGDQEYFRDVISRATENDRVVMGIVDLLLLLDVPREDIILYDAEINYDYLNYALSLFCPARCKGIPNVSPTEVDSLLDRYYLEYMEMVSNG